MSRYALSTGFVNLVRETYPPSEGFSLYDGGHGTGPVLAFDRNGNVLQFWQGGRDHWIQVVPALAPKEVVTP